MIKKGNLIIGQSGGPTMVINQSLVGAVLEALKHEEIDGIYGMQNGVEGLLQEKIVDLRKESIENLEKVANTPSSALGSCRYKPDEEDCEKIFDICKKYDIRYFFYIGGNDSAETSNIINEIAKKSGYELRVFHIPKTIDNDLRENDHCPGYGSAARYVALDFMGDNKDNTALPGIKLNIVMGRHAGWLTAASVLGKRNEDEGPHLIYIPERPVTLDKMADDIDKVYSKYGRALIAVSEGLLNTDGKLMIESYIQEKDSHGNVQLSGSGALGDFLVREIKKRLAGKYGKLRVRADTLGYAQRSFPTVASSVDAKEAREVAEFAVKSALIGDIDGSATIQRIGDGDKYEVKYEIVPLEKVARVTRDLPDEYINEEGNFVTEKFIEYAKPLVGELPELGRLNFYPVEKK